jgi:hypothetical protein
LLTRRHMTSLHQDNQNEIYVRTLERFRRGYNAMFALMDDFPEAKREQSGACGDWSPKQVLAHLTGWVREASKRYRDFEDGDTKDIHYNRNDDFAAFNSKSVQARAHLSWDDTVTDLRKAVHTLSLQAEDVTADRSDADPRYEEWLVSLWNDCIEHLGQLCQFIAGK